VELEGDQSTSLSEVGVETGEGEGQLWAKWHEVEEAAAS